MKLILNLFSTTSHFVELIDLIINFNRLSKLLVYRLRLVFKFKLKTNFQAEISVITVYCTRCK